ncbi:MAG TPA: tetratricopeptide repeat protein [Methanoregulaceae archaeon]|nr:tetratricopeptide repeat protein [Methanoregulaceae archaeon]
MIESGSGGTFGMARITDASEATTWKIQGNINYKQGNFEYALIFYENGLKIDPENIDLLNNKGMALIKLGRIEEARQCQKAIKKIKENNPGTALDRSEKPSQCTVKIKGTNGIESAVNPGSPPATTGFTDKALLGKLEITDIEENIELIKKGIDKVRLGRIKEAKDCQLRIKEMEENIELTKQGLETVKLGRIEENRKIKFIEENLELTRKGLDMIKLGRMKEATYYNQQLKEIEERIESARRNLRQVKPGAENEPAGNPGVIAGGGYTQKSADVPVPIPPVIPVIPVNKPEFTPQIKDIATAISESDNDRAGNPNRIIFIIVIVVILIVLAYLVFFK